MIFLRSLKNNVNLSCAQVKMALHSLNYVIAYCTLLQWFQRKSEQLQDGCILTCKGSDPESSVFTKYFDQTDIEIAWFIHVKYIRCVFLRNSLLGC